MNWVGFKLKAPIQEHETADSECTIKHPMEIQAHPLQTFSFHVLGEFPRCYEGNERGLSRLALETVQIRRRRSNALH